MKLEIRYPRLQNQFSRTIMYGQLFDGETRIMDASLAQILQYITVNNLILSNAQEILKLVVLDNGFAT